MSRNEDVPQRDVAKREQQVESNRLRLEPQYDVAILGGGPAGLAAAVTILSSLKLSVLVIEGQATGCQRIGESCPPDTLLLLRKLGVLKAFLDDRHSACPGYASVWGRADVGYNDFVVNPLGPGWCLDRRAFDTRLASRAESLGARIAWRTRFGTAERRKGQHGGYSLRLHHRPDQSTHNTTVGFVIDATGATARFARGIGIRKVVEDQLFALVRFASLHDTSGSRQVQLEATADGWWYHALLPNNRVVNMMVCEKRHLSFLRENQYQGFEQALAKTTFLSQSLNRLRLQDRRYHTCPIYSGLLLTLEGKDWLAIGDAASSFDPIAAQGIHKALSDGIAAGDKVAAWQAGRGDEQSTFSNLVRERFQDYQRNRAYVYDLEQRWPHDDFWRLRHRRVRGLASANDANRKIGIPS